MGMTLEQKRAVALASARARMAGDIEPSTDDRSTLSDIAIEAGKGLARGAASFAGELGEAVMGPFGPSGHAARLGATLRGEPPPPPEPSYGERISKAVGIEAAPQTTAGKYAGTSGEVLGSPLTYLGPGSLALKTALGVTSALGSEAAGQFAERGDLGPKAETAFRIGGGIVAGGGAGLAASERNLAKLAATLPSRETVKKSASQIYDALKTSDTRISAAGMQDLTNKIKTELIQEGARDYPGARGAVTLRIVDELPTSGGSLPSIDAIRRTLRGYKTSAEEQLHADRAVDAIDDYLMHVDPRFVASGNPVEDAQALHYAQTLWATHKQLKIIEEGSIKSQRRAGATGTGGNRINTARQEINRILNSEKKSRGLSTDVKDKMNEIVLGTWLSNRARDVGVYAPKGVVSAGPTIVAGFAGGAAAASAVAGTGFISKYLGEYLTQRQIRELEQLIKSESPMGKPVAQAIASQVAEQKAVPAAAAVRSALTSPLSPESGP